jgi:RNA polymerase sigma-70 factor (ECF subfamily)
MRNKPDLTLVQAACDGDADAIAALLQQSAPSITGFARKYCAAADIEDAVQETLWIVYQRIGYLRTAQAFVSWTFQIVRHHCYRLLARQRLEADIALDPLDALERIGEADSQFNELKLDVIAALTHLPTPYRQVVIMRDLEGESAAAVADTLGITVETVKSRLHRGRKLMREQLSSWRGDALTVQE